MTIIPFTAAESFVAGFEHILRDWAAGIPWETSFAVVPEPPRRVVHSQAFLHGARAACEALGGWLDAAAQLGKHCQVPAAELEALIARTRINP